ncbi:MAG: endonuclease III [Firmicutes bacterium]|nr:endonuclease III [Bacillota bacterium]MCL1953833.1 endonuclease III [Bacillota bacterium]
MSTVVPNAKCELYYNTPYQLLIAVVLSAQCTDIRVNQVTKVLFDLAQDPISMLELGESRLQQILYPLGFYKNKTINVLKLSQTLLDNYDGQVPSERQDLESLAGVGRKTANVILMECFNQPFIAVDTHVYRVSRRLNLSNATTPNGVEKDLYQNLPIELHHKAHHTILHFGRYFCKSQRPLCDGCVVRDYCTFVM